MLFLCMSAIYEAKIALLCYINKIPLELIIYWS